MNSKGVDPERRRFLTTVTSVAGGVGAGFVAVPFVASWLPSARAKAIGAPVEVSIDKLDPGQMIVEKWRGKPIWVVRRTESSLEALPTLEGELRDPESVEDQQPGYAQNEFRSLKPEFLIVIGLCTHLGCSPTYYAPGQAHDLGAGWKGGFFCPCHGSLFDLAGRVYKGVPAPTNLEVPPHRYLSETRIEIGVDEEKGVA